MKLAIISHTEHYKTQAGTVVGWGPTITEINHLTEIFDHVYHIAMLHEDEAPLSAMPYTSNRITFVPIPALGGRTVGHKFKSILKAPEVLQIVSKTLKKVDCFQLRTPTGIGVFLIPYLSLFVKTKGWFKYAGNWNQNPAPLGYALQRWMLKNQSRKVTINGAWKDQPQQCLTFENPCLKQDDLVLGKTIRAQKDVSGKLSFCFVGRLEKEKGVERILLALKALPDAFKARIDTMHFVGNGKDLEVFKAISTTTGVAVKFHGFLSRNDVFDIYKESHAFLLPSTASEGFPKVIAEAMNFGCIPVVSNISSIGQYVKDDEIGFLIQPVTVDNVMQKMTDVLSLTNKNYHRFIDNQQDVIKKFTFAHYNYRIQNHILK